ncbi:hypothetical protein BO70DRAFT_398716 [Aspergillus heteromorphus CBS 117.55]|uniref:Uncharacterized protein n=1 Tax=Aspergillus heteromorphus CBS 117.55 TaxID=1448321 RepID=A0A317VNG2_9EURO|nr:uncharacterized protein BO70DRAFT_398716 [Aspergillus heteromorphus CBS 117.55]PWY74392.1 hypothetical protein BO70DRAFT_398716 [Aspergillus heteromorphus CBS 117.55]
MKWESIGVREKWDLTKPLTVGWTHVDNEDDQTFCIYLTNRVDYPPVTELVLRYVRMDQDRVTIPPPGPLHIPYNCNYRLWASACGAPETIFAETDDFCIDCSRGDRDRDRDRDRDMEGKPGKDKQGKK